MIKIKSSDKIRTITRIPLLRRISLKLNFSHKKMRNFMYLLFISICSLSLLIFIFYGDYFYIYKIRFNEINITQLQNPKVYQKVADGVKWVNYLQLIAHKKKTLLSSINKDYPFIKSISYSRIEKNEIFISLEFEKPNIVYEIWDSTLIGSYNEEFYNLSLSDEITSWVTILKLPKYINDIEIIQWIYNRSSEKKLIQTINMIQDVIPRNTIKDYTFIPWNMLLILWFYSGQEVLFSLRKDINLQLIKLLDFQQYSNMYSQFNFLDIGSSQHIIGWIK